MSPAIRTDPDHTTLVLPPPAASPSDQRKPLWTVEVTNSVGTFRTTLHAMNATVAEDAAREHVRLWTRHALIRTLEAEGHANA